MTSIYDLLTDDPEKILYLGNDGAGKTGSLCSLIAAGYNLRLLNLDAKPKIIANLLTNKDSIYRKAHPLGLWTQKQADTVLERFSCISVTEEYTLKGPRAIPRGTAWTRLSQTLNNWVDGDKKFGNIATWTNQDVLAIDGLSRTADAAMNFQLAMNGRLEKGPQVGTSEGNDYSSAYKLIRDLLDLLKCDEIRCHVILICHIRFLEEPSASPASRGQRRDMRGFPQTIGQMLSPQIGQFFNTKLRAKSTGNYPNIKRVIVTNNDESIELKNTDPLRVKAEYPLPTGLIEYFNAVRQKEESKG